MIIPIRNVYLLLCYAWNTLPEGKIVNVQQEDCNTYLELFGRILESGVTHLLKRGLDREYTTVQDNTASPRGKIDLSATIKRSQLQQSRLTCLFDSLSHDVLHNRIVKTTVLNVLRCDEVNLQLRERLLEVYRRLHDVTVITISANVFSKVTLHRNNGFYGFLLQVCRLIHDHLLIDSTTGKARFKDFVRDERAMARVFEKFVYNFYRREQRKYHVTSESFRWQHVAGNDDALRLMPIMRTDVSLVSSQRHIVVDTKYYANTLQCHHARETIHSANVYQVFAYLRNLQAREADRRVEGILLYPTVSKHFDVNYTVHGHPLKIATVNLADDWKEIHERLLGLVH